MTNYDYPNSKGGQMMINRLYTIERVARGLRQEINPNDQFPLWTQNKVATAQDRLTTAMQYLVSKKQQMNSNQNNIGFINLNPFSYFFSEYTPTEKSFRRIGAGVSTIGSYFVLEKNKDFKKFKLWQKIIVWSAIYKVSVESFGFIGRKIDGE